jgi:hypothetical protein
MTQFHVAVDGSLQVHPGALDQLPDAPCELPRERLEGAWTLRHVPSEEPEELPHDRIFVFGLHGDHHDLLPLDPERELIALLETEKLSDRPGNGGLPLGREGAPLFDGRHVNLPGD